MKNRGFTLVELLAVIIIITLLTLLALPNIVGTLKDSGVVVDDATKEMIYGASDLYIANHYPESKAKNGAKYTISLSELVEEDLLSNPIKVGDVDITNLKCVQVVYHNGYSYELRDAGECEQFFIGAPALYDEDDNLIATWDALVLDYGLDLSENYTSSNYTEEGIGSLYDVLTNNNDLADGTVLVIDSSVTGIGSYALAGCDSLVSVTIPSGVTSIGNYAFTGCDSLTEAIFKNTSGWWNTVNSSAPIATNITSSDMANSATAATYLTSTYEHKYWSTATPSAIAAGLYDSNEVLLADWNTLVNTYGLNLSANYTTSNYSSTGAKSLYGVLTENAELSDGTILVIGTGITKIGNYALYNCTGIRSLTIPANVTSVGTSPFANLSGLEEIKVDPSNTVYEDRGVNAIIKKSDKSLVLGCKNTVIPSDIRSIGGYAFRGCTGLTEVTIPATVTNIGTYAFYGCTGLTEILIPVGVTTVGTYAFYNTNITDIYIPAAVTSFGANAIAACTRLETITIDPANTTYTDAGKNVVVKRSNHSLIAGCKNSIIPDDITSIAGYAFRGITDLTSVVIPSGVTSIGTYAFNNCKGLTSLVIPSGVTSVADYTFYGCSGLTSLVFEGAVTSVGTYAFRGCSGLTSFTLPSTVTSIGTYAFYGCTGLTALVIPSGVTTIDNYTFYGCTGLTSMTIPNTVTTLGTYVFRGCSNLASITLSTALTSIGNYAFYGCSKLASLTIPNTVTTLGTYLCYNCTSLTSLTLSTSLTSIGNYAFRGCSKLTSVTIPASVNKIGQYAFYSCSKLANVTFEEPSGWWYATSASATSGTAISQSDLSTTTTAATRLKTTYNSKFWFRTVS